MSEPLICQQKFTQSFAKKKNNTKNTNDGAPN